MKLKPLLFTAALAACTTPAFAADVGVSISVGQPGFYGQVNIGDFPQPRVIYDEPVVVYDRVVDDRPIYLHVPPGHEKHWNKHCARYNACGRRVYFVRDDWYNDEYVPRYRREHGDRDDDRRGDDDGDRGHDDHGRGHGNGHGKHKHDD